MAEVIKSLGQAESAAANAWVTLYTVPTDKAAVVSVLMVANAGAANYKIAVAHRVAGVALANKMYLVIDHLVAQYDSRELCRGVTLAEGDILQVRAESAGVAFNLYGTELDA